MDASQEDAVVLPIMSDLLRKLRMILQMSGRKELYASDLAIIGKDIVQAFRPDERLTVALSLLTIIQSLIENDQPTRALDDKSLVSIQADLMVTMAQRDI